MRTYAAQALAAAKQVNSPVNCDPQISSIYGNNMVVTLENNSPISHISIMTKLGSRYETDGNVGVSHMTRLCAGLATEKFSAFGLTRRVQQMGGILTCENGREHMAYSMSFIRDNIDECFELLNDVCLQPCFKPWEVNSVKTRLLTELGAMTPSVITLEMLHEAAFRNRSLGRSLFVPKHRIGKITSQQLIDFVGSSQPPLVFVGVGVEHEALVELASSMQASINVASSSESSKALAASSKYEGGEIRHEDDSDLAYVALAGPGAKIGTEEGMALAVAQHILGGLPGTKYGSHSSSKLASFVAAADGTGHAVALNASYSDAGLFGFFLVEHPQKVAQVLKRISKEMRSLKVSDSDVKAAKTRAKASLLMNAEAGDNLCREMGLQSLLTGRYLSATEASAMLDNVTTAAVQSALSSAVKGKVSMAAFGGISQVPYVDEL